MKQKLSLLFSFALVAVLTAPAIAQSTLSAKEVILQVDNNRAVEISNKTIEGDLDLTELSNKELKKRGNMDTKEYKSRVEVPVTFRNCTFKGDVLAYKVVDKEGRRRSLLNTVMNFDSEDQTLYTADFKESVVFENCTFEGMAEFKYSDFAEKASFADSKFRHEANFKYAKFNEAAQFGNVDFSKSANFKYAKFNDQANFGSTSINQTADFKYAAFQDGVSFKGTHFQGFADFKYTDFKREGDLSQVTFSKGSDFKYAKGSRYISTNR